MRRSSLLLFALSALSAPFASTSALAQVADPIAWRSDLSAARAEAEAAGKPLLAWFR